MDETDIPVTTNSKVIIQCTDPNGLFDRVEPRLSARSPLRNLHWKAPNRPLRSISNLNISLTREDKSAGAQSSVRRHQIPGLRETPYVKLLLVRCDDKETYKEKVRKEVRQWVKSQTPSGDNKSSSKSQEDHDASEWLVLHVVLPNTPAASQAKSSKHISLEASESTDSVNSKSKWPGKGSSTIFDKLRADFNSSKSGISRVAQVRLLDPGDKSTALTPAELEEQWQDLVDGLKSCILRSFDARVAQYESDIRERDSQRHLPGWNFCTFFILKEGLAKGFENLGLLEDALGVYDELSLGLDALVKDQARADYNDDSGALLSFSKESKALLRAALDSEIRPAQFIDLPIDIKHILNADRDAFPFDADRTNYQKLILSNEVSALDLRIYLFTREMEILNRQAQPGSTKASQSSKSGINPAIQADLVERATQFINLAGRTLRFELYHAWGGQEGLSEEELHNQRTVTGNIVCTWQWRAAMQILTQVVPTLDIDDEHDTQALSLGAAELSRDADSDHGRHAPEFAASSSRISLGRERSPSREHSQERSKRNSILPNGTSYKQSITTHPGSRRLALWVSKLVLMARHLLENLEATRPWVTNMTRLAPNLGKHGTSGVPNGEANPENMDDQVAHTELLAGLDSTTLKAAASSKKTFTSLYLILSIFSYRTLSGTGNGATSKQILTDLVGMEYSQGNYVIAARYLHSIIGSLPQFSYRVSEGYLLRIYADCLRNLDRPSDYAKCLISCLHSASKAHSKDSTESLSTSKQYYIDELFRVLPTIPATTLPAVSLFRIAAVSKTIFPLERRDGFSTSVDIACLPGVCAPSIKEIKLRLVTKDGSDPRHILLALRDEVVITAASTTVTLETPVTTQGWYVPDDLELCIGNLRLLHHFKLGQDGEASRSEQSFGAHSAVVPLLVYPSYRSFGVKMYPFPIVHLAEVRRLLLQVRPGRNNIKQCKLRLRTATAGLRLNIHDSKLVDERRKSVCLSTAREGDALLMIMNDLGPDSVTDVEIPYTMEVASEPAVTLRIEANYETDEGTFTFHDTLFVKVILPVTVNVQDVFRRDFMYSKFTVSPSTMVPLRLIGCKLEDNDFCHLVTGGSFDEPFVVFPKHPANWTVRLIPKRKDVKGTVGRMTLVVDFQSLDGVIFAILETHFVQEFLRSDYAFAARLLASHLVERVRSTWTEQDVEVAGLLQEFEVWKMEDMEWPSVLCAFDGDTRANIENWLRDWHSRTPRIKFSASKVPQRQLKLFVDVPPRPLLVLAFLDLNDSATTSSTATVGQPIMAELVITMEDKVDFELEGSFELVAPSDSWLIGGRRKGNVWLTQQPTRIQIVLFPQHLGHLLIPTVTLRCRRRAPNSGKDEWVDVTSELHNPTHGRSVLVTPDLRSTTVEIFGAIPDDGTGRLIASESRGGVG
ncbi:hypothetical protein G647_03389 [Cladophialophora carrionii CBS 160.54]|uniref:TMEM1 family protein n=1 Tax=Cladophialophora carrionii CBS 160.54 TaxID=1279043 RepID=V9DAZ9_9EURO|nr:uncharacterized protein G647_03389 [Cladophialophora carrionii CBS 160.54]ETI24020.1 hypothetical protein G647_03389 [Cladophialophora carrionii CBS 160.54]